MQGTADTGSIATRLKRPATRLGPVHLQDDEAPAEPSGQSPRELLTVVGLGEKEVQPDAELQLAVQGQGPNRVPLVFEVKSGDTLGLLAGAPIDASVEQLRDHITSKLLAWCPTTCQDLATYGAVHETLNHMVVKGAPAAVLLDGNLYMTFLLRRVDSVPGEAAALGLNSATWLFRFHVAVPLPRGTPQRLSQHQTHCCTRIRAAVCGYGLTGASSSSGWLAGG